MGELYRSLGGEGPAFALARFLVLFLLLVPSAALMGATLPVLVGHFEKAWIGPVLVEIDLECGIAWAMLAELRRRAGDIAAAEAALARAGTSQDSTVRTESALVAGNLERGRRRPLAAAERYREAQRWSPRLARCYLPEARALREGGDLVGSRVAIARGLRALPGNRELITSRAELGGGP